jgi:poly(hydroxyalkanoate) depolymerase family esterase
MARRNPLTAWTRLLGRSLQTIARNNLKAGVRAAKKQAVASVRQALKTLAEKPRAAAARPAPPAAARSAATRAAAGHSGMAEGAVGAVLGAGGARRYALYRPPAINRSERLPLLVMLHACTQDAAGFARCTAMNRLALRERCLVLYPEQDRLSNAQGCWNWFDTRHGRAAGEAASILRVIDQVMAEQPADPQRVAVAGLSAGASMAALLATEYPARFGAVMMHSGVPPGAADSTLSALRAMRGGRPAARPAAELQQRAATAARAGTAWPPLLVLYGSADAVVSPANSLTAAQLWADAAGARAGPPRALQRGQRYPMTVTDSRCADGRTAVTRIEVAGLGHAWSGGAAGQPFSDAKGPDASRLLWAFAQRQFRATARR